jgi:hypothetical protein
MAGTTGPPLTLSKLHHFPPLKQMETRVHPDRTKPAGGHQGTNSPWAHTEHLGHSSHIDQSFRVHPSRNYTDVGIV